MINPGVDLGGVIFTPGEVDQLKDELVLRLHKVNEGSGKGQREGSELPWACVGLTQSRMAPCVRAAEWEWTSGLAEHINRILQLEFEKTVRHC